MDAQFLIQLGIQVATLLVMGTASFVALRFSAASAKRDAAEAQRSAKRAHERLDQHEKRLTVLEVSVKHSTDELKAGMTRLEGQVSAVHVRLDELISSGVLRARGGT